MILLSYDGSSDAQAAIDCAAQLMPGQKATVLTVWEPFIDMLTRTGAFGIGSMGMAGTYEVDKIDQTSKDAATETAADGVKRAKAAGLDAEARCARREHGIGQAILAAASDVDADVIVMGTRGLSGMKSFLLGSVSHAVVQHADRAVLVVPSQAFAERRRSSVERDSAAS